jgi:hypothetical protein
MNTHVKTLGNAIKSLALRVYYFIVEVKQYQANHEVTRMLMSNKDFKDLDYNQVYAMVSGKQSLYDLSDDNPSRK